MFAFLTEFCFLDILRFCPGVLGLLRLPVQVGTEAPECCRGQAREPVHCQHPAVYWADIVQRIVRFPLPQVTELSEAQFLWLQKRENVQSDLFFLSKVNKHILFTVCALTFTLAVVVRGTWPVALPYSRFSCTACAPTSAEKAVARWRRSSVFCGGIFSSRANVSEVKRGSRICGRAKFRRQECDARSNCKQDVK